MQRRAVKATGSNQPEEWDRSEDVSHGSGVNESALAIPSSLGDSPSPQSVSGSTSLATFKLEGVRGVKRPKCWPVVEFFLPKVGGLFFVAKDITFSFQDCFSVQALPRGFRVPKNSFGRFGLGSQLGLSDEIHVLWCRFNMVFWLKQGLVFVRSSRWLSRAAGEPSRAVATLYRSLYITLPASGGM
jgi:hypothetical protein